MRPGEIIVAIAGVACLAFGAALSLLGRPSELFVIAGVALLVVSMVGPRLQRFIFGPTGVTIEGASDVARQVLDREQAPDLKLAIAHLAVFGPAEAALGSDHLLSMTAVNTGDKPIGVHSMGVTYTNGRWSPFQHPFPSPTSKNLPAILQPQETATMYETYEGFMALMREQHLRIADLKANLADGTERKFPAPDDFRAMPN